MSIRPSLRDLTDQDPYPFLEQLRAEGHPIWDESLHAWLVTSYEDCAFVQRREDLFAMPWVSLRAADVWGRRGMFLLQGREHRGLYSAVARFFSPGVIRDFRTRFIRPLIEQQIDRFAARGRVEIASEFAEVVPVGVIAAMLGLDWQGAALLERCNSWSDDIFRWADTYQADLPSAEVLANAVHAAGALGEVLLPIVRDRRDHPREDLVSTLWETGRGLFDDWNEHDVVDQCRFLFVAGHMTTTSLMCNLMYLLLTHASLLEQAIEDRPGVLPGLVEEALRLLPPLQLRVRVATQDVELGGVRIRQGDRVDAITAAANRDPEHYAQPCAVDTGRRPSADHLAFNIGPRACAGAPLARAEALESIDALLTRLPRLRLDRTAEPPRLGGFVMRTYRPLHVEFEPA